jgi:hypothetical protein
VLAVAVYNEQVGLRGPCGEEPPVYHDVDREQAERVYAAALEKPYRFGAHHFFTQVLPQLDDALVGIHNQGVLSTRELRVGVPDYDNWEDAKQQAHRVLSADDSHKIVNLLGYNIY